MNATPSQAIPLARYSGEQLMLMAVFGNAHTRDLIDAELDRRANPVRSDFSRAAKASPRRSIMHRPAA